MQYFRYVGEFVRKGGKVWWLMVASVIAGGLRIAQVGFDANTTSDHVWINIWMWATIVFFSAVIAAFVAFFKVVQERDSLKQGDVATRLADVKEQLRTYAQDIHDMRCDAAKTDDPKNIELINEVAGYIRNNLGESQSRTFLNVPDPSQHDLNIPIDVWLAGEDFCAWLTNKANQIKADDLLINLTPATASK